MRVLGILCLLLAASVGLASQLASLHPLMQTIENATNVIPGGLHPALLLAILGTILIWMSPERRWKPAPASSSEPSRPMPRSANREQAKTVDEHQEGETTDTQELEEWKVQVLEAMEELTFEKGVSLHIDRKKGVPFTLILERCTPGRCRRSIDQLGRFLKPLPIPPRVAILFRDCESANVAWQHLVTGALLPHLGRESSRTVAQPDRVDLIFHHPDPCYTSGSSE